MAYVPSHKVSYSNHTATQAAANIALVDAYEDQSLSVELVIHLNVTRASEYVLRVVRSDKTMDLYYLTPAAAQIVIKDVTKNTPVQINNVGEYRWLTYKLQ